MDVALAVPERAGRVLVARRDPAAHQGGLWEFPGGKIGPGERPERAAARELLEETGLRAERVVPLLTFAHDYGDVRVRLHVYVAPRTSGEVPVGAGREWRWVDADELDMLEMPAANDRIRAALRRGRSR